MNQARERLLDALRVWCDVQGLTLDESPTATLSIPIEGGEDRLVPTMLLQIPTND